MIDSSSLSGYSRYVPLFLVFVSGIGFSIQTLFIKLLEERGFSATFHFIFSRGFIQLIIASCFIACDKSADKPPLFGENNRIRTILFCRSFFGYVSVAFSFLTVERLPIGDATVLVMLSPLFASIGAYFILGEPWRLPELFATIVSLTGVVFVARPPFIFSYSSSSSSSSSSSDVYDSNPSADGIGVLFGMIASVTAGLAYVCVRMLGTSAKMPWYNVVFAQALGQVVFTVPNLFTGIDGTIIKSSISYLDIFLIVFGGFIGAWSQIAMTSGMQREKSASATAMRMSDVVFGFIWQVAFTKDNFSWLSGFGALLVTGSILIIVFFKPKDATAAAACSSSGENLTDSSDTNNNSSNSKNSSNYSKHVSNSNISNNSNNSNDNRRSEFDLTNQIKNIELGSSFRQSYNNTLLTSIEYSPLAASIEYGDNDNENGTFDSQLEETDDNDNDSYIGIGIGISTGTSSIIDADRDSVGVKSVEGGGRGSEVGNIYDRVHFNNDLGAAFEQDPSSSSSSMHTNYSSHMLSQWKSFVRKKWTAGV